MSAFDHQSLWNKSKVFVDRAMRARDNGDSLEFHLWATIALELLGKATLARLHPSLVADPSHFPSLLAACGRQNTPSLKSITAKTVFDRLKSVVHAFDERMEKECMLMANRRNAELHSGETPLVGLEPKAWVPAFWRVSKVLIADQGQSLEDWLGVEEAQRVDAILADAAELTRQTVLARISRRSTDMDIRFPPATDERREAEARANARPIPISYDQSADTYEDTTCPACRMKGWLFGSLRDEEVITVEGETDLEWGPMHFEIVQLTYDVEEFRCPECGLRLEGRDEIAIAGLPPEIEREEEQEPDYGPEYGND